MIHYQNLLLNNTLSWSAASRTSTAEASTVATATVTSSRASATEATSVARTTKTTLLTPAVEQVEAVDDMNHGIRVDGVVLSVGAHHIGDVTAVVAHLSKYVVELQRYGQRLSTQEALRYLGIPYQLVGVHTLVVVSTATLIMNIGGKTCPPRCIDVHAATVCKLPCVEVYRALQLIT